MGRIERSIPIEQLIRSYPASVRFLIRKNLPCLVCGEPVWGTLEEVARGSGMSDGEITLIVKEMNLLWNTDLPR